MKPEGPGLPFVGRSLNEWFNIIACHRYIQICYLATAFKPTPIQYSLACWFLWLGLWSRIWRAAHLCTSQDSGSYSVTGESMLSQKWPPGHQHPIGRLGTQTLRWGGGGTAAILIYSRPSILWVPSCSLWVILQLGLAQQGPRVPCPLPCHVHFIYPDPRHSSHLLATQPHRGSVTRSPPHLRVSDLLSASWLNSQGQGLAVRFLLSSPFQQPAWHGMEGM